MAVSFEKLLEPRKHRQFSADFGMTWGRHFQTVLAWLSRILEKLNNQALNIEQLTSSLATSKVT